MLGALRQAAEDTRPDRSNLRLDADRFGAFLTQLDAPVVPIARLRAIFVTPAP